MFESSNIRSVIFDLDGTLVETEHLKAQAYAKLLGDLSGKGSSDDRAIELYRSIVGATDLVVCQAMIDEFSLSVSHLSEGAETDIETLHRLRMQVYREYFGTPAKLRSLVYPHNLNLAKAADADGCLVGVATMSCSDEASRVLDAIGLSDMVETVVGIDHVEKPKPSPDAFWLAMERLKVKPGETLIVEDSPRGALAAAASGAYWICVATEFSKDALKAERKLDQRWVAWEPSALDELLARRISG